MRRTSSGLFLPDPIKLPRGVREFMPAFSSAFQPSFATPGGIVPHWSTLGGTIADSHIAAWTPKGAASLAASYVQYGTFGTGLTVGVAPTFDTAQGWIFDGSSQYLNTNIIPNNTQTQTVAIRYSGFVVDGNYRAPFGARTVYPSRTLEVVVGTTGDNQTYWGDGTSLGIPGRITSGIIIIAGGTRYLNGVNRGTTPGWAGASIENIYIGAESNGGGPIQYAGMVTVEFVYYDLAFNSTQVGLLNTAILAL